jgi:acetoacetyl-CoA synthetase
MDDIPEWFAGARLNYAENLLKYNDERLAVIETGETEQILKTTWRELNERVRQMANALRKLNVRAGDTVAAYMPNSTDAVLILFNYLRIILRIHILINSNHVFRHKTVAMLAATSIGAIWSSASPDFGTTVSLL